MSMSIVKELPHLGALALEVFHPERTRYRSYIHSIGID